MSAMSETRIERDWREFPIATPFGAVYLRGYGSGGIEASSGHYTERWRSGASMGLEPSLTVDGQAYELKLVLRRGEGGRWQVAEEGDRRYSRYGDVWFAGQPPLGAYLPGVRRLAERQWLERVERVVAAVEAGVNEWAQQEPAQLQRLLTLERQREIESEQRHVSRRLEQLAEERQALEASEAALDEEGQRVKDRLADLDATPASPSADGAAPEQSL